MDVHLAYKINVTAFALLSSLSQTDVQSEWEKAIQTLRRDGARPKEVCPFLRVFRLYA